MRHIYVNVDKFGAACIQGKYLDTCYIQLLTLAHDNQLFRL